MSHFAVEGRVTKSVTGAPLEGASIVIKVHDTYCSIAFLTLFQLRSENGGEFEDVLEFLELGSGDAWRDLRGHSMGAVIFRRGQSQFRMSRWFDRLQVNETSISEIGHKLIYARDSFPDMRPLFFPIILSVCIVSSCGRSPTEPAPELDPQDGLLEGVIDGSAFRGTGMFGGTPDVRMGFGGNFQFSSHGVGESDGEIIYGIWHDGVIPPSGSYDVSFPSLFQRGFWLFYDRESGEGPVHYAAYAGTIEIDSSSSGEVRGSFQVSARPRCVESACPALTGDDPEAETIELSGTFRLVPRDVSAVPL